MVAASAALRLWDLGRRSLWFDEAWAAVGCLDGPFDISHVGPTPLLFAALVRGSVALLGRNEIAVRLPAALFSIGGVVLGYRLGRDVLGRGGGLVSALLLGLLPIPVFYGKEFKPYATEVLLALAIALLTERIRDAPASRGGWLLLAACVILGAGLTPLAPVLVAGAFLVLIPIARRAPVAYATTAIVGGLASFLWLRLVFTAQMAAVPSLVGYWHLFFLPEAPPWAVVTAALRSAADASTFGLGTWTPHLADQRVRLAALPPRVTAAVIVAMLVGSVYLVRRGAGWLVCLFLAWHVSVAVAAFEHLYPYGPARIALVFLAPTAVLLAAALVGVAGLVPSVLRPLAWVLLLVPLAWPLRGTWRENVAQPYEYEELRPVLSQLFAHAQPTDAIWVSPGATYAFRFYVPHFDDRTSFAQRAGDAAFRVSLLAALQRGNGRLWLVFSHHQVDEGILARRPLPDATVLERYVARGATVVLISRQPTGGEL